MTEGLLFQCWCLSSLPSRRCSIGRTHSLTCLSNNSLLIFFFSRSLRRIRGRSAVSSIEGYKDLLAGSFFGSGILWIFFLCFEQFEPEAADGLTSLACLDGAGGAGRIVDWLLGIFSLGAEVLLTCWLFWVRRLSGWDVEILGVLSSGCDAERVIATVGS